jgi:HK97 family phage major capsid protein
MSKYQKEIAAYEAKRASLTAAMEAIMDVASKDGTTLDAKQQEEYDNAAADIVEVDGHLKRLRELDKIARESVKAVNASDETSATETRTVPAQVKVTKSCDPGIRFARLARVKGFAGKTNPDVVRVAEQMYGNQDPELVDIVKAAVSAGSTVTGNWAANLVGDETSAFADFVEFLRPQTILGRFGAGGIPALRRVPFRVPLIGQNVGGDGYWVGEGAAKPLTALGFTRSVLEPLKVANIAVATMELLRDSSPSAEIILRDQLAAALRARLDTDFINPTKAPAANVSPGSITNGVTAIVSTGNTADAIRADIKTVFGAFIAANNAPTTGVWIMPATVALAVSLMVNPLGQPEFPGISMSGGTLFGLPVIVSEYVPNTIDGSYVVLVNASDIYLADDGDVSVDMSTEASLEMDNAPAHNSTTPTPAQLVSMFQTNSVAFRAERTINWARRRPEAVAVLSKVNWGSPEEETGGG